MRGHPSFRALRAVDHGELPGSEERALFEHVDACPRCRDELSAIRDLRDAAARATSPELPDLWPGIRARVVAGEAVLLPSLEGDEAEGDAPRDRVGRPARSRRTFAAAAAVLLLTAAGAVAGTVGPLRGWVERVLPGGDAPVGDPVPVTTSGIDVPVPPGGLTVELRDADPAVEVRIARGEGAMAEITARGPGQPRFRSGPDRVVVTGATGGRIEIRVPSESARVRLVADGVTVAEVRGGVVFPRGGVAGREVEGRVGDLVARATGRGDGDAR